MSAVQQALFELSQTASLDLPSVYIRNPGEETDLQTARIPRASVALVVRFNTEKSITTLDQVFHDIDLQANGVEFLLIKRTTRDNDRWSGHVALPGGRRDPDDDSDIDTAKREALEEVGLDLEKNAVYVGELRQRYVTLDWGQNILMVLCCHVFVVDSRPLELQLQASEVDQAFWYPLDLLVDPAFKCTLTPRPRKPLFNWRRPFRSACHFLVSNAAGSLKYPGIAISPFIVYNTDDQTIPSPVVWGLTYGILTDFIDLAYPKTILNRPLIPISNQWDTSFFALIFGRVKFEIGARTILPSTFWRRKANNSWALSVRDPSFNAHQASIWVASLIRVTAGSVAIYKIFTKLLYST
ncbi:NUDIX hydrolase domain-like protein [Lipomyces japonicus]|uniref:NUDIX hydrolase domain-like protein n=1 Tax=Lipomyces japonicus TaxID=56871 RepID=UPI0034CFEECE